MDKKKIGAGFAGALQKAADAAKLAKLTVQDMTADAKQSRGKKAQQKADAQKVPASKDEPTAVEPPENAAPEIPCIATRNALQIIYYGFAFAFTCSVTCSVSLFLLSSIKKRKMEK